MNISIQQIFDSQHVGLGTHYALIVNGEIVARAVNGTSLADLRAGYRAAKAVRR